AERAEEAIGDAAGSAPARALQGDEAEEQRAGDRDRCLQRPGLGRTELPHAAILTDPGRTQRSAERGAARHARGFGVQGISQGAAPSQIGESPSLRRVSSAAGHPLSTPPSTRSGPRRASASPSAGRPGGNLLSIAPGMQIAKALCGEGIPGAAFGLPARSAAEGTPLQRFSRTWSAFLVMLSLFLVPARSEASVILTWSGTVPATSVDVSFQANLTISGN